MTTEESEQAAKRTVSGVAFGGAAFLIWGISPLYWKALGSVPAVEIVLHRIVWSFLFLIPLVLIRKKWPAFMATLKNKRTMLILLAIPIHRSADAAISPPLFLFGSWGFLLGLFELVDGSVLEIVFLAVACGFVYLGVQVRSRTLNFTSTIAILAYTGYFTGKHFADSIGWPLALIAFGLLMIGISALALRIDRNYIRAD